MSSETTLASLSLLEVETLVKINHLMKSRGTAPNKEGFGERSRNAFCFAEKEFFRYQNTSFASYIASMEKEYMMQMAGNAWYSQNVTVLLPVQEASKTSWLLSLLTLVAPLGGREACASGYKQKVLPNSPVRLHLQKYRREAPPVETTPQGTFHSLAE